MEQAHEALEGCDVVVIPAGKLGFCQAYFFILMIMIEMIEMVSIGSLLYFTSNQLVHPLKPLLTLTT